MAISDAGTFLIVNIVAQRARQLMQGATPLIRTKSRKPAAIAIREVEKDLIPYFMPGEIPELPSDEELEAVEENEE